MAVSTSKLVCNGAAYSLVIIPVCSAERMNDGTRCLHVFPTRRRWSSFCNIGPCRPNSHVLQDSRDHRPFSYRSRSLTGKQKTRSRDGTPDLFALPSVPDGVLVLQAALASRRWPPARRQGPSVRRARRAARPGASCRDDVQTCPAWAPSTLPTISSFSPTQGRPRRDAAAASWTEYSTWCSVRDPGTPSGPS